MGLSGVESYDVRSLPNATTVLDPCEVGHSQTKTATRKVPNLYILLVMSKSLRCVNVYRWMWMFSTMLLPGNGRALVVASDIFGIHAGRHKEICDSIADEVTDRVVALCRMV